MQHRSYKLASIRPLEEHCLAEHIKPDLDTGDGDESIDEAKMRRTPKKTWTNKTTATQRRVWRRKKKLPGARAKAKLRLRKPRTKRRTKLLRQWKARRNIPKKKPGRGRRLRMSLAAGNPRVANLMEEVQEIVTGIEEQNQDEMIKAYANAALVADSLSERFLDMAESIAEHLEDDDFSDEEKAAVEGLAAMSEDYEALAEEAAQSAEALHECVEQGIFNEEVNVGEVTEHFKGLMSHLLDGCDFYAGLTEDEEDSEGEDEDPLGEGLDKYSSKKYPKGSGKKGKIGKPSMDHA